MNQAFIQIPINLLEYNISNTSKIIYGLINYLNKAKQDNKLDYQKIADYLNITYITAYRSIKELLENELVEFKNIKETKKSLGINTYIICKEPKFKAPQNFNQLWRMIK